MICYYEVRTEAPYLLRLSEYRHSSPQKSLGKMCKRGLDFSRCEVFRFYKLHPNNWIEPLPMFCPRRVSSQQHLLFKVQVIRCNYETNFVLQISCKIFNC